MFWTVTFWVFSLFIVLVLIGAGLMAYAVHNTPDYVDLELKPLNRNVKLFVYGVLLLIFASVVMAFQIIYQLIFYIGGC